MNSDPIIELNDGTNISIGGFKMRIDYTDPNVHLFETIADAEDVVESTIEPIHIPVIEPQPIPIAPPWYSRLWTFLNMDVRDIYQQYIRPLWRR